MGFSDRLGGILAIPIGMLDGEMTAPPSPPRAASRLLESEQMQCIVHLLSSRAGVFASQ